jgi:alkylation response protein AidB-like acyl-CoA dehydrogenase
MAQIIADRRDVDFVLHEQLDVSRLSTHKTYAEFNRKVMDMIVSEARTLAVKELLPVMKTGDTEGCRYENGRVKMPGAFKRAWYLLEKGGWFAPCQNPEWGGQGMPHSLNVMAQNYLFGANMALMMVAGLNHGAGEILERFGTDTQKRLYLEKLYTGQWGGTMALTEPESGSNLGDLQTRAVKNPDGTYSLTGTKIFISGGDQDITDNIIHLVLARCENAPPGSKGISLFVVPKIHVNDDGSLGAPNDIACTGIEEKMGLHGSPTCTLALGSSGLCTGTLVGGENKGLAMMFVMMNMARLMVGAQGLACASSAYLHALEHAKTRIQGPLPAGGDKTSVAIINHPDVRRMLLTMKSYTEGMRSLLCYIGLLEDKKQICGKDTEKQRYQDLIDILIPVGKGYVTDRAVDVCNLAIQVFGGYGYTCEYPVEQIFRDVRITTIYEGTNGIQAMDLAARKLGMKNKRLFDVLLAQIRTTIARARKIPALADLAQTLEQAVVTLADTADTLLAALGDDRALTGFAFAGPFLEVTGDLIMAWMLLWRAVAAKEKTAAESNGKNNDFYDGQIHSARFFMACQVPVTLGKMASIRAMCPAAVQIRNTSFSGK